MIDRTWFSSKQRHTFSIDTSYTYLFGEATEGGHWHDQHHLADVHAVASFCGLTRQVGLRYLPVWSAYRRRPLVWQAAPCRCTCWSAVLAEAWPAPPSPPPCPCARSWGPHSRTPQLRSARKPLPGLSPRACTPTYMISSPGLSFDCCTP